MHHSIRRSWRIGRIAPAYAALVVALLSAGCGVQAGEDYPGEPLLELHGDVVVAALTGGQAVEPALCFQRDSEEPRDPTLAELSPEAAEVFALSPELEQARNMGSIDSIEPLQEVHIVSVESRGDFPSQFEVAVYLPPPDVVAVSTVEGEPRKAEGYVCAVLPGYGPLTYELNASGTAGFCSDTECAGRLAFVTRDGERSYARAYRCPAGMRDYDPSVCTETVAGDETLLYETYAEGVIGAAWQQPLLVYLAEPAPAGSFTAWELGASEGLAAGYHVFVRPSPDEMNMRFACQGEVFNPTAYDEINAVYGDRIRAEFGEDAQWVFGGVFVPEGDTLVYQPLPADVLAGGNRILADYEMANCPMPRLTELDPLVDGISVTIDVHEGVPLSWPGAVTPPSTPPPPSSP